MFYELSEKAFQMEKSGKRVIRLNIGDTNLPSPPVAIEAAVEKMKSKKSSYVSSAGIPELRKKIAEREGCGVENVIVGSGSKQLIFALLSVLAEKNANVMFPAPHWPAYKLMCKKLGMNAVVVETRFEDNWAFKALPADKANVIMICNPLNPTSSLYPDDLIEGVIQSAADAGVPVIIDEAYRGVAFRKIPNFDAIRVRSFSKEFNMEGWRLGYVVAPDDVIKKMIQFGQTVMTCTPDFIQYAGIACLENEESILSQNVSLWKERAAFAKKILEPAGFVFTQPESAMYVFATHEGITDAKKFTWDLLEKGVVVAPGTEFGPYNRFIRICLNQPEPVFEEAVRIMQECLR